jgi:transposase
MSEKLDVYSRVTNKIIADLARGNLTWLQPWQAGHQAGPVSRPLRAAGKAYRLRPVMLRDAYVCPAGTSLTPVRHGRLRDLKKIDYGNPKACRDCPLRARCTNDVRSVSRLENEDALDRMAERLKARPEILDRRRETVEHPFGSIKQWMNQGAFLTKGLEKVRAEFSLTALAYNLRRALNILGVEAMTAAVAA